MALNKIQTILNDSLLLYVYSKNQRCLRWSFLLGNISLLIILIGFIISGAKLSQMNVYHSELKFILNRYIIQLVLFTLFYIIIICVGILILAKKFKRINISIVVYAICMFTAGCLLMAG